MTKRALAGKGKTTVNYAGVFILLSFIALIVVAVAFFMHYDVIFPSVTGMKMPVVIKLLVSYGAGSLATIPFAAIAAILSEVGNRKNNGTV